MKFNIPKIIRRLEMSGYAEEMDGLALHVWVNPPRSVQAEYWNLQTELVGWSDKLEKITADKAVPGKKKLDAFNEQMAGINKGVFEWFANIWSQDSDPDTHIAAEEIEAMADEDPAIWAFLSHSTRTMIDDHKENARKN